MAGRIQSELDSAVSTVLAGVAGSELVKGQKAGLKQTEDQIKLAAEKEEMAMKANLGYSVKEDLKAARTEGLAEAEAFKSSEEGQTLLKTAGPDAYNERVSSFALNRIKNLEQNKVFQLQKKYVQGKIGSVADYQSAFNDLQYKEALSEIRASKKILKGEKKVEDKE